jgi:hypothetical protein
MILKALTKRPEIDGGEMEVLYLSASDHCFEALDISGGDGAKGGAARVIDEVFAVEDGDDGLFELRGEVLLVIERQEEIDRRIDDRPEGFHQVVAEVEGVVAVVVPEAQCRQESRYAEVACDEAAEDGVGVVEGLIAYIGGVCFPLEIVEELFPIEPCALGLGPIGVARPDLFGVFFEFGIFLCKVAEHGRLVEDLDPDDLLPEPVAQVIGEGELGFEGFGGQGALVIGVKDGGGHIVLVAKEGGDLVPAQGGKHLGAEGEAVPLEDDAVGIGEGEFESHFLIFDYEITVLDAEPAGFSDADRLPRAHSPTPA